MVVSKDRRRAAVLEMTGLFQPNASMPPLRLAGLEETYCYQVSLRQQSVELDSFRTLLNHVLPLKLKADEMLVHLAGELYQMPLSRLHSPPAGICLCTLGFGRPSVSVVLDIQTVCVPCWTFRLVSGCLNQTKRCASPPTNTNGYLLQVPMWCFVNIMGVTQIDIVLGKNSMSTTYHS